MKLMRAAATSSAKSYDLLYSSQIVNFNFSALGGSGSGGRGALKKKSILEEIQRNTNSSKSIPLLITHSVSLGSDFGYQSSSSSAQTRPIIVVPASVAPGNICLGNAKSLLQEGHYAQALSTKPPEGDASKVLIDRRIGDQTVTFEVHDSVTAFTDREWKRVVAVFVNGQTW